MFGKKTFRPQTPAVRIYHLIIFILAILALLNATGEMFLVVNAASVRKPNRKNKTSAPEFDADEVDPVAARASLPRGCESYKIVKGNPLTAKIVLLGEDHEPCRDARIKCATAIVRARAIPPKKSVPKSKVTMLFEDHEHTARLSCDDYKVADLSDDCRGWNEPKEDQERNAIDQIKTKEIALRTMLKIFEPKVKSLLDKPFPQQKTVIVAELNAYIEFGKQLLSDYKSELKERKAKNPQLTYAVEFEIPAGEQIIRYAETVLSQVKQIKQSDSPLMPFAQVIVERNGYSVILEQYHHDVDRSVKKPNRYLASSIKEAVKQSDTVIIIGFAGNAHVRKPGMAPKIQTIVQELYDETETNDGEVAVASCKL